MILVLASLIKRIGIVSEEIRNRIMKKLSDKNSDKIAEYLF